MMKRTVIPLFLTLICVVLAGCFQSNQNPAPSPSPSIQNGAGMSPGATGEADQGGGATDGATDGATGGLAPAASPAAAPFDWAGQGETAEQRVAQISEVETCRIVANEDTALVGVQFTGAYQGEMTQRIRDMIAGEIMGVDPGVRVVAVTAAADDVAKIEELANQQRSGAEPADFKQQIDQIVRNTTTLR